MGQGYKFENDTDWKKVDGIWKFVGKTAGTTDKQTSGTQWDADSWSKNYGAGGTGYGVTTYGSDKFNCKHTPDKGLQIGDITVYPTADKHMNAATLAEFDVVCPLTDSGTFSNMYNEFCGLIMWIPIKDMTAPDPMRLRVNVQRIIQFAKNGGKVAFWCIGSHGRTGTILATIIGMLEPNVDPIDETRSRHCKHAIETQTQINAIFEALDKPVPDKWKPAAAAPKTYPAYVNDGKAWSNDSLGDNVTEGFANVCDLCEKAGGLGKQKLHWYSQILCHEDCYNAAVERVAKEKERTSKVSTTTIPSATTPTPDSPAGVIDPGIVDEVTLLIKEEEEFRAFVLEKRPYKKYKWSRNDLSKLKGILNKKDTFGDIICLECDRLIVQPADYMFVITDKGEFIKHKDCVKELDDTDADVLCSECWDQTADEDGYCSMECQQIAFNKISNGVIPHEIKDEDTAPIQTN